MAVSIKALDCANVGVIDRMDCFWFASMDVGDPPVILIYGVLGNFFIDLACRRKHG